MREKRTVVLCEGRREGKGKKGEEGWGKLEQTEEK